LFRYVLYSVIIVFFRRRPELRRVLADLDLRRRRYLIVLFTLVVFGQMSSLKYQTYPFVNWGMYAESGSVVKFVEYRGVRSDGSEAPFPVAHLVRTHSTARAIECPTCGKRLLWRLRDLTKVMEKTRSKRKRDAAADLYERTLRAAWRGYKERNPDADFESVRMYRNRTRVKDYRAGRPIESTFLWEIELDPSGDTP
jgi:DNA-directed RNA polymerase subunit RPC12/RpoP